MKILTTPPSERRTAVELTDKELQLIQRGLRLDTTKAPGVGFDGGDENSDLHDEFCDLFFTLDLASV